MKTKESGNKKQKKIIIVTSDVPFVHGGHRIIAENTCQALIKAGFEAEVHYTPQNRFGRQVSAYLINRLTDLNYTEEGKGIDRLISMRFPSYAVKHPDHILWLVHRLREYYDLWDEFKKQLGIKGKVVESTRRFMIHRMDNYLLKNNVKKIYTISRQVSERLKRWGGFESEVLYPPVAPVGWHSAAYGNYFLCVSRLMKHKRIDLFVKAAAEMSDKRMKFLIVGSGPEEASLKKLITKLRFSRRFEMTGQVDQLELINLYSSSRAVVFTPLREEYGFVTLEAFRSDKPVITVTDSGGPTELVRDSQSGYITAPEPAEIALKMDILAKDPSLARKLGRNGNKLTRQINWDVTVSKLLKPFK
jgi:glycosyltransferase involved in cell wall biosynthesis